MVKGEAGVLARQSEEMMVKQEDLVIFVCIYIHKLLNYYLKKLVEKLYTFKYFYLDFYNYLL